MSMLTYVSIYAVFVTVLGSLLFMSVLDTLAESTIKFMSQPRPVRIVVACLWPVIISCWAWGAAPKLIRKWVFIAVIFTCLLTYGWSDLVEWII